MRRCVVCGAEHHGDGSACGRCAPIVDGVERLRRKRPFVVVGPSSFPPHEERVLSGDESLWAAQMHARELADAGYTGLHVENERTNQRWAVGS